MSHSYVYNNVNENTKHTVNINKGPLDISSSSVVDSVKNAAIIENVYVKEELHTAIIEDIYVKEEPVGSMSDSDSNLEMESITPLMIAGLLSSMVCLVVFK